ncbi:SHOCT domain-containing protein, partial [Brucellaceae bacterium C25G]
FTFSNYITNVLVIFMFIIWFWLLITVFSDLFSRHDSSGFEKALWVLFLIIAPFIGVLAYLLFQGQGMSERNQTRAKEAQAAIRHAAGFSVADELEKLSKLKAAGTISDAEFAKLRAKLV